MIQGCEVFSLNGEHGIYSARYCGEHGNNKANIQKLLAKLAGNDNRNARFVCALAYVEHELDPTQILAYGFLEGQIAYQTSGSNGFGYDPIFVLPQLQKTLAEISEIDKNQISHRALALDKMIQLL